MQCFNPTVGFHRLDGSRIAYTRFAWQAFIKRKNDIYNIPELRNTIFSNGKNIDLTRPIKLPCAKCDACRMNQARDLATRCMMEFHSSNQTGIFLTLTYDDEHLPADKKFCERHVVLFMKKLRKIANVRSMGVAEYGPQTHRPHYHILIFGWEPKIKELVRKSSSSHAGQNYDIFTSKTIAKIWQHGKHEFGTITEQSCSYVARYTKKKNAKEKDEFKSKSICRSRRPGLGAAFTDRYAGPISQLGSVMLIGPSASPQQYAIPRYVFDRIKKRDTESALLLHSHREKFEQTRKYIEEGKERVQTKKIIFLQKISKLKRNL